MGEKSESNEERQTKIVLSDEGKFKATKSECKTKVGCEFEVEALEDGAGSVFMGGEGAGSSGPK